MQFLHNPLQLLPVNPNRQKFHPKNVILDICQKNGIFLENCFFIFLTHCLGRKIVRFIVKNWKFNYLKKVNQLSI